MMPGPIIIKECPHCKGHFKESTIASGNTFGARFWTDGKMEADMLPEVDWLVTCPNCLGAVWLDASAEVGRLELPYQESTGDYKNADQLEYGITPSAEGYLIALQDATMPIEKQTYIRIRLWQLWNDTRRYGLRNLQFKKYEIENLEQLLKLIDESDESAFVAKAEINRELGRFDEAIRLLDWPANESDVNLIQHIRQLAYLKDSYVQELT